MKRWAILVTLFAMLTAAIGCQKQGATNRLSISGSEGEQVELPTGFEAGYYRFHDDNSLTILLVDGPMENPSQAITIKMFWKPKAARTPISPEATNCSIRYVIFAGDQVGIYGGGGFVYPYSKVGKEVMRASVWNGSLQLTDNSDGFADRLVTAAMQGRFITQRDDAGVEAALRNINIKIRDRLGYPHMVMAD